MAISSTTFKKGHAGYARETNGTWKGKEASYVAIHMWLKANFGKPDRCENKQCVYPRRNAGNKTIASPKRFEYALIHGKEYDHKRENFIMLCASCHARYDKNNEKIEI